MSTLVINEKISIPWREINLTAVTSQGPGGQHVNRVHSRAVLRWNYAASTAISAEMKSKLRQQYPSLATEAGDLLIASQRFRSQQQNRADCIRKLRLAILDAAATPTPRRATQPTRASGRKRLQYKKLVAQKKRLRQSPDFES